MVTMAIRQNFGVVSLGAQLITGVGSVQQDAAMELSGMTT
jgi:hypothetical protein